MYGNIQLDPDDKNLEFEFILAVISVQIQSLMNLLDNEQANRIRGYIFVGLSSPELGVYPVEVIKKYQDEWDLCLEKNEMPLDGR